MVGSLTLDDRRFAVWVCLLALVGAFVVLPGLHAAVHAHEHALAVAADTSRPRVVVHRHGHCHGGSCHDDHGEDRGPGPSPRHRHDGDRDGEHGQGDAAHLGVALAAATPPMMPPLSWMIVTVEYPWATAPTGAPARHDRRARGPPATLA